MSHVGAIGVDKKIKTFSHMCRTITRILNGKVRRDTRLTFYNVTTVTCSLYASMTWRLNAKDQSWIQASEMRFLLIGIIRSITEGPAKK